MKTIIAFLQIVMLYGGVLAIIPALIYGFSLKSQANKESDEEKKVHLKKKARLYMELPFGVIIASLLLQFIIGLFSSL